MRVVDDDRERLARVDPLHAAGDALDRLEARADRGRVEPEALAQGDDRQRVVRVETAGQPELEARVARRGGVGDPEPPRSSSTAVARTVAAASAP